MLLVICFIGDVIGVCLAFNLCIWVYVMHRLLGYSLSIPSISRIPYASPYIIANSYGVFKEVSLTDGIFGHLTPRKTSWWTLAGFTEPRPGLRWLRPSSRWWSLCHRLITFRRGFAITVTDFCCTGAAEYPVWCLYLLLFMMKNQIWYLDSLERVVFPQ